MPSIRHLLHRSLVALLAILAASSVMGEASACSMTMPAGTDCATACGCCSSGATQGSGSGVTEAIGVPGVANQAAMACEPAPSGGCGCRSQEPVAPEPRPGRVPSENRPEPSPLPAFGLTGDTQAASLRAVPVLGVPFSTSKTPLYLRIERLLF